MMLTPTPSGFLRDGQPHLIISGAVHYFRVHPDQWRDRLTKLAAMGCNTVETYVAWNFHAPTPDEVDFTGWRDLGRFLEIAAELGLDAIVRPGPYICAEWEGGGFPGWLLRDRNLRLRVSDPAYLAEVDRWFDQLIPQIARHQPARGDGQPGRLESASGAGNVVMVQVENEYGSFGDDRAYLEHLRDGLIARGIHQLLVTSDGPGQGWLSGGTVDGALATVNFGSRTAEVLQMCAQELPDQPQMCMEFWNGWFDHVGEEHHLRDAADAAAELDTMLAHQMSVNFYMAHGGTNFGLWAGANHANDFTDAGIQPTVTSYDYDSAIAEDGRLSPKFYAFREVIGRYRALPDLAEALAAIEPQRVLPATELTLDWKAVHGSTLWHSAPTGEFAHPPSFEDIGLERGVMLLRRRTQLTDWEPTLKLLGLHDRAWVFCDGDYVGRADRNDQTPQVTLPQLPEGNRREVELEILVESQGRVNFGPQVPDRKGILRGVWLSPRFLNGWQVTALPLDALGEQVRAVASSDLPATETGPRVASATLEVSADQDRSDAYLNLSGHGHGVVYLDDFCLGRFDAAGPQRTLYVPGPLLTTGSHTCTVLDFEPTGSTTITVDDNPTL